ncbi:MAG: hypothetical protein K0S86_535 [Geminicoccaceae bacterium]|jgi:hypothetical protein|nr:hypothetical protein [Geminicoccaceae bacterium]
MSPSLPGRITICPGVLCQHVEGNVVLLNLGTERYRRLDDAGTRMWDALSADGAVERLVAEMLIAYDVAEQRLRSDVQTLFGALASAGLVAVEP